MTNIDFQLLVNKHIIFPAGKPLSGHLFTNKQIQALGKSIASYLYQILCYLTYNSDDRPFPFELEWPAADDGD